MESHHGIFDIDSFITIFYNTDINESDFDAKDKGTIYQIEMAIENAHMQANEECFTVKNIYAFSNLLHSNFLHEEIHYWQAITSPVFNLNYLNLSKLLYVRKKELNIRSVITDCFPYPNQPNDIETYKYIYKSHRMNLESPSEGRAFFNKIYSSYKDCLNKGFHGTWQEFSHLLKSQAEEGEEKIIYEIIAGDLHLEKNAYNIISDTPPLAMPFIIAPHLEQGKDFLAYAGMLDYFDIVYFTGDYLMESYATINEYISKNLSIPEYDVAQGESNKYLGVYEVYRRMHKNRYDSEKELAISFLALIDLCFTTDPLSNHDKDYEFDEDFRQQNVSIPYRFGKLIYRALGFRPFEIIDENNLLNEIVNWQDEFCIYQGYYKPEICIKHTIEELIVILTVDFDGIGYCFSNDYIKTVGTFKAEESDWEEKLQNIIIGLNDAYKWHSNTYPNSGITLQNHMILSMVNALIYKLNHRGKMILSASYKDEIRDSIEPALYIVGGQYAFNHFGALNRKPLNDFENGIYQPIENLVIKSMAKTGKRSCGFMESYYPCRYTANGYGCPLSGLNRDEIEKRKKYGMDLNWCHYTRVMNILEKRQ